MVLVSVPGAMLVNAKIGSFTFHFYKDLDGDNLFDANEPSPSKTRVQLIPLSAIHPAFWFRFINRYTDGNGEVAYRFVLYPRYYRLFAIYHDPALDEYWTITVYGMSLGEEDLGSTSYWPMYRL